MATTSSALGLTIPDINDTVTDFVQGVADSMAILDTIYPVGIYVQFDNNTDPNVVWPNTTWSKEEGRVLIGAGSTYPLGSTGGSATHSHDKGSPKSTVTNVQGPYVVSQGNYTAEASSLMPYRAVNMWHRTA